MSHPLINVDRPKRSSASRTGGAKTTVGFVNLGCSKNQVDSEVMLGTLVHNGFSLTADPNKAEVVIINTCGFIEPARREAVEAIKEFGAHPVVISVIVDRGGSCAAMAANAGIRYVPMLTAPELGYDFGS